MNQPWGGGRDGMEEVVEGPDGGGGGGFFRFFIL